MSDAQASAPKSIPTQPRRRMADTLLVEVAWEVVNPVGGIYTVIRSKLPAMDANWGSRYCLAGPFIPQTASVEFEAAAPTGPFGEAVKALRSEGLEVGLPVSSLSAGGGSCRRQTVTTLAEHADACSLELRIMPCSSTPPRY